MATVHVPLSTLQKRPLGSKSCLPPLNPRPVLGLCLFGCGRASFLHHTPTTAAARYFDASFGNFSHGQGEMRKHGQQDSDGGFAE